MKTFREYLEGKEVNESFLRKAALAGAGALGMMGIGGQAKAEDWKSPESFKPNNTAAEDWKSFRSPESFKPNDTPQHHRELLDSIFARDEAREAAKTPYEKLMDRVREARAKRGETPKININKLNKYVGEDTPYKDTFEKLKRFYQKVPDDGQRDPRAPRPDPEVEEIMKQVEAQQAKQKAEEREKFLQSMEKAKIFAR
jgi:hypothetical protein